MEIPFFTDFPFEVFLPNLPLLPFTSIFAPFSEPHQAVIFVLGAKVTPGLYGESKVKPPVFWENLQPFG